jgi:hypothetical protein
MFRLWPGNIDSAFIGKQRRSRQFYPLMDFHASSHIRCGSRLGVSMGVPGLPLLRKITGNFPLSGLIGKRRLPSRPDPGDSRPSRLKKRRFARIRAANSLAAAQAFTMASKHQVRDSSLLRLVLTL